MFGSRPSIPSRRRTVRGRGFLQAFEVFRGLESRVTAGIGEGGEPRTGTPLEGLAGPAEAGQSGRTRGQVGDRVEDGIGIFAEGVGITPAEVFDLFRKFSPALGRFWFFGGGWMS